MDYNSKEIEEKWQGKWLEMGIYRFEPNSDKPVYSIDVPPRYASGTLHIGHAMHYVHIDFAARYKRMRGYNVFNPLCFDINGMPIEVSVEKKYNLVMKKVDRKEFVRLCKEFAAQNVETMKRQFVSLGACFDSSIYYQTDEEYYRRITQISFLKLYKAGLIYKGKFPVNYCPRCSTAMAHAEIEYATRTTNLNYIKFKLKDADKWVVIATTRPELLVTCKLIAVHPDDEEKRELIGKKLITPIFSEEVEVIADDAVDMHFGTGIVMICTIGDKDDLKWVHKYNLPIDIVLSDDGKITKGKYEGLSIKEAQEAITEDMRSEGLLVKQEEIVQNVGTCWRCHTPTEIIVKDQWFLKILPFKKEVLDAADNMAWHPEFMKTRLYDWVDALAWDWVISRQRYFATPIPLWECAECGHIITAEEKQCYVDPLVNSPPVKKCPGCNSTKIKGCEDVFDTWMDSSITALYNAFWERDEKLFSKLYPMSLRPQAHEIIRTWLFYTILRSLLLTKKQPFKTVMIDGFMMGPDNRPMHTSWGNVVDPEEIIEKYSSDALRYFSATCALGQDNTFREKEVIHGVRFCTKFWNAQRFIGSSINKHKIPNISKLNLRPADKWILSKFSTLAENVTAYMEEFMFDKAIKEIEFFIWHEFADHYIEMAKYRTYKGKDKEVIFTLYTIGLGTAKLLSPFLPHITEEVYAQNYKAYEKKPSIHISSWPEKILIDSEAEKEGEIVKDIISKIRQWKVENGIHLNAELGLVEIIYEKSKLIERSKEDIANTVKAKEFRIVKKEKNIEERVTAVKPIHAKIGPKFKEMAKEICEIIEKADAGKFASEEPVEITLSSGRKVSIPKDFMAFEKAFFLGGKEASILTAGDVKIAIAKHL